jgi:hypothetical protein
MWAKPKGVTGESVSNATELGSARLIERCVPDGEVDGYDSFS